jgi:antitoxin (DNA-binding transcriptional repressor) of toxin-antitoxin stability system
MKRYTVSQVRERLADALDEAERGVPVVIERKGVRYILAREVRKPPAPGTGTPDIEILDPALDEGQWTWTWGRGGVKFSAKRLLR